MSISQVRFQQASLSELQGKYGFALAHLCAVKPTDNMRLKDFFQLIVGIDEYIEASKQSG